MRLAKGVLLQCETCPVAAQKVTFRGAKGYVLWRVGGGWGRARALKERFGRAYQGYGRVCQGYECALKERFRPFVE